MKALIVIDVQNDFVTGALGTKQAVAILSNLKSKIDAGIAAGDEIIFTRDTHGADYADTNEGRHLPVPHCIKGTEGWQVVREIDRPDCVHIDKPTFGYTDWAALLGGREITEIRAEYKKAAVLGDTAVLMRAAGEDGYVVSVCDGDGSIFANVELKVTPEGV